MVIRSMCLCVSFITAEQQNKDIPKQVQDMTYKIPELEKSLSTLLTSQIPRMQENITAFYTHVCTAQNQLGSVYSIV